MRLHHTIILRAFTVNLFVIWSSLLFGQTEEPTYNQAYNNSYYEQKVSLFEILPQSENDIVFLGNSITDIGEWAEIWGNMHVKNRGVSSDITAGVLARLDQIIKGKPAKLFIMIGINDIARNIPEEVILNNYSIILNEVISRSPKTQVYVQSILPTNNTFTEYKNHQNKIAIINRINSSLKERCNELNLNYIDLNTNFSDEEGSLNEQYTNDGLHLNGAGYMLWKKLFLVNGYCCD